MLKKRGINAIIFNIRYKLIFQNEKYFCPEFLPISCCVLTISNAIRTMSDLRKNSSDMLSTDLNFRSIQTVVADIAGHAVGHKTVYRTAGGNELPYLCAADVRAYGYVPARLMCRLICNLPEYSIRIFNHQCSKDFNYLKVSYLLAYVNIFLYLYIMIIEQKILK